MKRVFLSLGSNMGDRHAIMDRMIAELSGLLVEPVSLSRRMETEPLGMPVGTAPFLNAVIAGYWHGTPLELLESCERIEILLGRTHKKMVKSRSADIDILLIEGVVVATSRLTIPHGQLLHRRFCLEGIRDIDPYKVVEGTKVSVSLLLKNGSSDLLSQKTLFL